MVRRLPNWTWPPLWMRWLSSTGTPVGKCDSRFFCCVEVDQWCMSLCRLCVCVYALSWVWCGLLATCYRRHTIGGMWSAQSTPYELREHFRNTLGGAAVSCSEQTDDTRFVCSDALFA